MGGFLDEHRGEGDYRIEVRGWRNLERIRDLYFVRPKSLRLVLQYLRDVGPITVARKILSRSRERYRNEKYISCGIGRVLEAPAGGKYPVGADVYFLASCHPACVERLALPESLLAPVDPGCGVELSNGAILYHPAADQLPEPGDRWWAEFAGWSPFAGIALDPARTAPALARAQALVTTEGWGGAQRLELDGERAVEERRVGKGEKSKGRRKRAVLFGYGNYAKTQLLPHVSPFLDIACIHEIDPTQIPLDGQASTGWDTAPVPRDGERYDAFFIAGYHHTHAELAIAALAQGAYAVVEKPLAVDHQQRTAILEAEGGSGRLFTCFHKRYLPFNALAVRDLGVQTGEPIAYHCIVYEVALPALHWYRWPNSKSRLISNGCHWIDHFLFLNGYPDVVRSDVTVAADGTINCSLETAHGAFFTMVLTDQGSPRIGVQDYVELRANGRTVRIANGSEYSAEGSDRILRRKRINKVQSYAEMYRQIGRAVMAGLPGDSRRSIEVSTRTILDLEAKLPRDAGTDLVGRLEGAAPAHGRGRP